MCNKTLEICSISFSQHVAENFMGFSRNSEAFQKAPQDTFANIYQARNVYYNYLLGIPARGL